MTTLKRKSLIASGMALSWISLLTSPVAAQTKELCEGAGGTLNSAGDCVKPGAKGLFDEGGIFRNVINVLIFIVGVASVIMLIIGAIRYVVSGGDANAVKGAKDTILYAIIGIVVAAAAFAIVTFVISSLNT